jgi:hypothetical protein
MMNPFTFTSGLKKLIFPVLKILIIIFLFGHSDVSAQVKPKKDLTYTVEPYEKRIQLEYINNVYIPKDLTDALRELDQKIDVAGREKFALMSEEDAATKVYFSFGRWMSVNWGMDEGSRITLYFNNQGIAKVEDMIRILMLSYHRHINQKELRTDELLNHYKDLRKKEYEAYLERVRKEGKDAGGGN